MSKVWLKWLDMSQKVLEMSLVGFIFNIERIGININIRTLLMKSES